MRNPHPQAHRCAQASRLMRVVVALVALVALVVSVSCLLSAPAVPAHAAGPGEYSPPDWLPLRRTPAGDQIRVGCGYRSYGGPLYDCNGHHSYWAIDYLAPKGTIVYAAGAGQVVQRRAGEPGCSPAANYVDVDHDPGQGGRWSNYWHLDEVWVSLWDWVDEGTPIGTVGDTGMGTGSEPPGTDCGSHLHYVEPLDVGVVAGYPVVDPGPVLACHGADLVSYPSVAGFSTWEGLPWGSFWVHSGGSGCWDRLFLDVGSDHPFYDEIAWAVEEGVTEGFDDGTFRPTSAVTRQALAAFLHRLLGGGSGACEGPPFSDVGPDHPFCSEISWLVDEGIAQGFDDGTFRPAAAVSRQAMVAFLARIGGVPATATCVAAPFPDVAVDHPFCASISWAVDLGITQGYGDGTFRSTEPVARQAAAAFLARFAGPG